MGKYSYDESGDFFNYFVLSILALVLIPTTWSSLFPESTALVGSVKKLPNKCPCNECLEKKRFIHKLKNTSKTGFPTKLVLLTLGWALFAWSLYAAATSTQIDEMWNPYGILEIEEGLSFEDTKSLAKSSFRKLAIKWHPDKVTPELAATVPDAAKKYDDINKAQLTLTNEEAFKNWQDYGHPDGKPAFSLGIALPSWLVDEKNNFVVLAIYALIFGIGLPIWVSRWWSRSKNFTKDKIMHETMGIYYRELKENMPVKAVIELLATANEFADIVGSAAATAATTSSAEDALYNEIAELVKTEMATKTPDRFEKSKKYAASGALAWHYKTSILFYAHLLRVRVSDPKLKMVQAQVVLTASHLVKGMLQIAISRNWLSAACNTIELGQNIIQATYPNMGPMYQLPLIGNSEILKHFTTKKRNITSILELLSLSQEDRTDLLRSLNPEEIKLVETVAKQYPVMKVKKAMFSVLGEPAIIPNAIVTLIVKIKLLSSDEAVEEKKTGSLLVLDNRPEEDDDEEPKKQWWSNKEQIVPAHCPYFPEEKGPVWWVMLGDIKQNRLITMTKTVINKEGTARLQFQSPPDRGQWKFQVFVKSDSYIGFDYKVDVDLKVEGAEAAPLEDIEDDISEPDEDTIAGQMAAMKNAQKGPKGEYDDSSDDSDNEGDQQQRPGRPAVQSDDESGPDSDFVE